MISAVEAKRQTILNSKCKKYLDKLESEIKDAIDNGMSMARIAIDDVVNSREIASAISIELIKLGYKVSIKYPDPITVCRSDQCDFYVYITVTW